MVYIYIYMVLFNLGAKNVTSFKVKSDFGSKGFNDYLFIQVQDHGMRSPLGYA